MNSFVAYDFDYVKHVMADSECMKHTQIIITATGFLNWCFVIVTFTPIYNNKNDI